jgi:hypothetical protein
MHMSAIQPCAKRSLAKYLAFLEVICNASSLKEADNASLLWLWVILSCYSSIDHSDTIKQNSCNAGFTFLSCSRSNADADSERERLVVKFQLNPDADDIVLDNVNGFVVNKLTERMPRIKYNFMEYVDSCTTFVDTSATQPVFPLDEILIASKHMINNNELIDGLAKLKATMKKCPASICKSVKEPESLTELIKHDEYDFDSLAEKLFDLFATMRLVGGTVGFTHNDAHLGNVLYDGIDHSLVLIDYGRILFSGKLIKAFDRQLDREITDQIMYERLKRTDGDICLLTSLNSKAPLAKLNYTDLMKCNELMSKFLAIPKLLFLCEAKGYDFLLKNLYLFDVMCISMNILVDISNHRKYAHPFFLAYDDFAAIAVEDGVQYVNVCSVEEMYRRLLAQKRVESKHILCLGFFWYAFLIEYLYRIEPELEKDEIITYDDEDRTYIVDFKALADDGYIWHRMQVLSIPDPQAFCEVVEKNKGSIQSMINLIMDSRFAGESQTDSNAMEMQGGASTAKPVRTLETQLRKVGKTKFQKEFKAYTGGGGNKALTRPAFNAEMRAYVPPNSNDGTDTPFCYFNPTKKPKSPKKPNNITNFKQMKNNNVFQFN